MPRRKVLAIVGTRPNFMKMAPVQSALMRHPEEFEVVLVHTGQHYDTTLSEVFFRELGLSAPDHMLGVGSGTHTEQTARVMEGLESVLDAERPDVVLVPGDVNSTLAAALASVQAGIPVAHVEAGLRSFDRTMPEELNRVLTDQISDLLFTHSPEAERHLIAEGRSADAIHYVGNTMIDTLVALRGDIDAQRAAPAHGLEPGRFLLVTLHRPALVDGPLLGDVLEELGRLDLPILFPVHPRTRQNMKQNGLAAPEGVRLAEPLGYLEFLSLLSSAAAALTDSGGIQEEATFLGVPCFTLRDNTERPVTVELGTNVLLGLRPGRVAEIPALIDEVRARETQVPPLWDGHAAERIVDILRDAR